MKQRSLKQRLIRPASKTIPSGIVSFFIPPSSELSLKDRVQVIPKRNHWNRTKDEEQ